MPEDDFGYDIGETAFYIEDEDERKDDMHPTDQLLEELENIDFEE